MPRPTHRPSQRPPARQTACQAPQPVKFWRLFAASLGLSLLMTSLALAYERWLAWKKA